MTESTLTYTEARQWLQSRLQRMHYGLCATEQLLLDERKLTDALSRDRDRLAAEVAALRAELGTSHPCTHVRPHER